VLLEEREEMADRSVDPLDHLSPHDRALLIGERGKISMSLLMPDGRIRALHRMLDSRITVSRWTITSRPNRSTIS
jgi:hypothetical protein